MRGFGAVWQLCVYWRRTNGSTCEALAGHAALALRGLGQTSVIAPCGLLHVTTSMATCACRYDGHKNFLRATVARRTSSCCLVKACKSNWPDCVKLLLADAHVDPASDSNIAVRVTTSADVLQLLLADPRVNPGAWANDAVRRAASRGDAEAVQLLLKDTRVDIGAAVQEAALARRAGLLEILLADPRAANSIGKALVVPHIDAAVLRVTLKASGWHPQLMLVDLYTALCSSRMDVARLWLVVAQGRLAREVSWSRSRRDVAAVRLLAYRLSRFVAGCK